jgi:hypothetical protein
MALRTGSLAVEILGVKASMCCHPKSAGARDRTLDHRHSCAIFLEQAQDDRDQAAAELRHVTTLRVNRFFTRPSDHDPRSGGDA